MSVAARIRGPVAETTYNAQAGWNMMAEEIFKRIDKSFDNLD